MYIVIAVQLLLLAYFTSNPNLVQQRNSLKSSWKLVAGVAFVHAGFTLIRSLNYRSASDLMLTEVWKEGFCWFLIWCSLVALINSLFSPPATQAAE
jgi:hypothetical protein